MTTRQGFDPTEAKSEFSLWLRDQAPLDARDCSLYITDIDYVVHQFMTNGSRDEQRIMLIEEKRFGAMPPSTQLNTLYLVDMAMKMLNGKRIKTPDGATRRVTYHGLHTLSFQNTSPRDGAIWWNSLEITRSELIAILRFDKLPPK